MKLLLEHHLPLPIPPQQEEEHTKLSLAPLIKYDPLAASVSF